MMSNIFTFLVKKNNNQIISEFRKSSFFHNTFVMKNKQGRNFGPSKTGNISIHNDNFRPRKWPKI